MQSIARLGFVTLLSLSAAACSVFAPVNLPAGATEAEVVARLGKPTHVYPDGQGKVLEYMLGPAGQGTRMAHFDASGKLVSFGEALTMQNFGTLKPMVSNREDILRTVGAPSEIVGYGFSDLKGWNYPYRESGIWDSQMTLYVDQAGIMHKMENGPDPRRMPRDNARD